MAIRYQVTKGTAALSKKIELEVLAQIRRNVKSGDAPEQLTKFMDNGITRVYDQARAYYAGTLETAGRFMRNGYPLSQSVLLGSSKFQSISRTYAVDVRSRQGVGRTEKVQLTSGRRDASKWRGLPLDYIAVKGRRSKSPGTLMDPRGKWSDLKAYRSTRFWKKTGKLSSVYDAWLAQEEPRKMFFLRESKKALRGKLEFISGPRDKGQNLWQSRFQLRFPDLGNPAMNAIFRRSFVTLTPAKYRVYQRDGLGKPFGAPDDISRIAYPEYSRPILARFAAQMGRRHRAALTKLLKSL